MNVRFGLLYYKTHNIGDEIQSLAARQFLPRVDTYLDRDALNAVRSEAPLRTILNGWFKPKPNNWPPSEGIDPLLISFHVAPAGVTELVAPASIAYLRRHEPIGCRDTFTQRILEKQGVQAYFSGCLTLTLESPAHERGDHIVIADLDDEARRILPEGLRRQAIFTDHSSYPDAARRARRVVRSLRPVYGTFERLRVIALASSLTRKFQGKEAKFRRARELLETYATARLVITSRLHCALPCLAFGTPVLFVNRDLADPRFEGLLRYLRSYSVDELRSGETRLPWREAPANPGDIAPLQSELRRRCQAFIGRDGSRSA